MKLAKKVAFRDMFVEMVSRRMLSVKKRADSL
jgi:hypothetical protein